MCWILQKYSNTVARAPKEMETRVWVTPGIKSHASFPDPIKVDFFLHNLNRTSPNFSLTQLGVIYTWMWPNNTDVLCWNPTKVTQILCVTTGSTGFWCLGRWNKPQHLGTTQGGKQKNYDFEAKMELVSGLVYYWQHGQFKLNLNAFEDHVVEKM